MKNTWKVWKWIAGLLPMQLALWAAVRVMAEKITPEGQIMVESEEVAKRLNRWHEYATERRVWFHSQNLTDEFGGKPKGPIWRHGRAWLHLWRKCIGTGWTLLSRRNYLALTVTLNNRVFGFIGV